MHCPDKSQPRTPNPTVIVTCPMHFGPGATRGLPGEDPRAGDAGLAGDAGRLA